MRFKIFLILIIGFFLLIIGDLVYLQVLRGGMYYRLSKNNRIRVVPLEGWRGRIFDRKGVILADNILSYNIVISPQDIEHEADLFAFLSEVLDKDEAYLQKIYK